MKKENLFNYLNKIWFRKNLFFYNYKNIINSGNYKEVLPHFFATNNIADSLHNKINIYSPKQKISNINFIIAIRNIVLNYETKNYKMIRYDFVTKTLIEIAYSIKYDDYNWIYYQKFKSIENENIKKSDEFISNNQINVLLL